MKSLYGFAALSLFLFLTPLPLSAQLYEENFDYASGTTLTSNGWTAHSGNGTNPITVITGNLSYSNYPSTGVGNYVRLAGSGEDDSKFFTTFPVSSDSLYASFLVSVDSARTAGDYFFHLKNGVSSTSGFFGKVFVRKAANNKFSFGVSKVSTSLTGGLLYSDSVYEANACYLIVMKYKFNAGATDDEASLFVFSNPELPGVEPATPTLGPTTDSAPDPTGGLDAFALRQGGSTTAAFLRIDGIRVGLSWADAPLPITLASFKGTAISGKSVKLDWSTVSEINNYGFEVQRSSEKNQGYITISGLISGHGTTNVPQHYSYTDNGATSGTVYYRLKQIDLDKTEHYSEAIKIENGDVSATPKDFALLQNYPNPFNPSTEISYQLSATSVVSLKVFNALGQEVATLVNEQQSPGSYTVNWNAGRDASGMYFCKIQTMQKTAMIKMLLVR